MKHVLVEFENALWSNGLGEHGLMECVHLFPSISNVLPYRGEAIYPFFILVHRW